MQYIDFKVQHQTITRTDKYEVVGNSQNYLYARFQLCKEWEDITVTAVFSTNNGKHYSAVIEDGECLVPWEVLTGAEFWVGVFGGDRMTTSTARVAVKPGVKHNASPGTLPSPTAYERLVAIVEGSAEAAENAEKAAAESAEEAERSAVASKESAAEASGTAAELKSELDGVKNALDNLPDGSTVVVNDLTTGGTKAALSAEMGKTLGQKPNPSLTDNGHFLVNQRGKKEYTRTTTEEIRTYTVDRWLLRSAKGKVVLGDGVLIESTASSNELYFEQRIAPTLAENETAFSLLVDDVEGDVFVSMVDADGKWTHYAEAKRVYLTKGLTTIVSPKGKPINRVSVVLKPGAKVKLRAAKLEYGSAQTLAHWDGGKWVLNETPNYNEELAKCCSNTVDEIDYFANNYRAMYTDSGTLSVTNSALVDEMVAVAKSYYEQDAQYYRDHGERYFEYKSGLTCFYTNLSGTNEFYDGKNWIDCSSFVGLVLRGIPYSKSPYALPAEERKKLESSSIPNYPANTDDYCWAVDPFEWQAYSSTTEGKFRVRTAAHQCRWLMYLGCGVSFKSDFSDVEPGDIIFYAETTSDGQKNQQSFMGVTHVAFCATKEAVTEGDTDFAGYPFKHQIYESTRIGDSTRTFFYDYDEATGEITSTRYLEKVHPETVIAICRPRFLQNINGVVKPVKEGGTGATNGAAACRNIGAAVNRNLLDNWYGKNPVNQRGLTEYDCTANRLTVDRWELRKANSVTSMKGLVEVTADGVKVTSNSVGGALFLAQFFEDALLPGEYTVSALVKSVSGTAYLALYRGANWWKRVKITSPGLISFVVNVTDANAITNCRVAVEEGASVEFSAVKLERGGVQTLAHYDGSNWVLNDIPDYAEELWKCQRYYQLFSSADKRPTAFADYRPSMLKEPTLGTIDIGGTTYYYAEANP